MLMDLDDPLDFENEDPLINPPSVNKKRFALLSFTTVGEKF